MVELVSMRPGLNLDQQISDEHIEQFSRSRGKKWRSLPPYLNFDTILIEDIERHQESSEEDEKRLAFFTKWKHIKDSKATYSALFEALLQIECREDAEHLQAMFQSGQQLSSQQEVNFTVKMGC